MKKIIVFILAFIYLGVSSGIAMEIHYCMGKKAGIEFFSNDNKKCGKCGMTEKKGCCSDEHKFYKLKDSHNSSSNFTGIETHVSVQPVSFTVFDFLLLSQQADKAVHTYSPPIFNRPAACIFNCIFRI